MIGRADVCQIIVPTEVVSHLHAIIEQDETGNYVLRDNNSANGTYMNGYPIWNPHILQDQNEIGLGTKNKRYCALKQFPKTLHAVKQNFFAPHLNLLLPSKK